MASRGISVGVKIDGDAKGFKAASEDAQKATEALRKKADSSSRQIEQNFKQITIAAAKVGAAILITQKAFETFEKIMSSNQLTGDALEITLGGINEAAITLAQNLATADFSVSLRDAIEAGRTYAAILDDLGDRTRSVEIISAKNQAEVTLLKGQLRDTSRSEADRLKISTRINEIAKEELTNRKELATKALDAIITKSKIKYKISLDEAKLIQQYVEDYSLFTTEQQDALTAAFTAQSKLKALEENYRGGVVRGLAYEQQSAIIKNEIRLTTERVNKEQQKYIPLWRPINDLSEEQRDLIKDVIVQWYGANKGINEYLSSTERVTNKITDASREYENLKGLVKTFSDVDIPWGQRMKAAEEYYSKLPDSAKAAAKEILDEIKEDTQAHVNVWKDAGTTYNSLVKKYGEITAGIYIEQDKRIYESRVELFEKLGKLGDDEQARYLLYLQRTSKSIEAFKSFVRASVTADVGQQGNNNLPFDTTGSGGVQPILGMSDALKSQLELVNTLQSAFESMFSNIEGGAEAMGKAFVKAIEMMAAEMAARAVMFAILLAITGGTGELFKTMGSFSKFMLHGFKPMADGGIVSGPTLANIGEYAGARNNPEVVAPLDKLKDMLGNGNLHITVDGKIKGKDLALVLTRYADELQSNT